MRQPDSERPKGRSNATPEWLVLLALVYTVAWIVAAFSTLFEWNYPREHRWIVWTSTALLAASLFILARGMGFIGTRDDGGGS